MVIEPRRARCPFCVSCLRWLIVLPLLRFLGRCCIPIYVELLLLIIFTLQQSNTYLVVFRCHCWLLGSMKMVRGCSVFACKTVNIQLFCIPQG
ncbi:hypothetical protein BC826DRAFT_427538 [Russula brevipes]|nr:hypothetical protein BC826DRAFT_427538 [Russula brevipes]